jgi:hypothetical protein
LEEGIVGTWKEDIFRKKYNLVVDSQWGLQSYRSNEVSMSSQEVATLLYGIANIHSVSVYRKKSPIQLSFVWRLTAWLASL